MSCIGFYNFKLSKNATEPDNEHALSLKYLKKKNHDFL